MISFSIGELVSILGIAVSILALLSVVMFAYTLRRNTKYDTERHRVELEMMRKSIESQMHGLTEKLLATESRWRDVNHLLISSQNRQPAPSRSDSRVFLTPFLQSCGITPEDTVVDQELVFVLTPFHPDYQEEFDTISLICRDLGLKAIRGDEQYVSGDVFPHILKQLVQANLVITNIEGRNPNVFYELGLAHGLSKPTILISPTPTDVPFDVRTKRIVLYSNQQELRERLRDEIARTISRPRGD